MCGRTTPDWDVKTGQKCDIRPPFLAHSRNASILSRCCLNFASALSRKFARGLNVEIPGGNLLVAGGSNVTSRPQATVTPTATPIDSVCF